MKARKKMSPFLPFWMAAFEVSRDAFDVFYKDENTPQNSVWMRLPGPASNILISVWAWVKKAVTR